MKLVMFPTTGLKLKLLHSVATSVLPKPIVKPIIVTIGPNFDDKLGDSNNTT